MFLRKKPKPTSTARQAGQTRKAPQAPKTKQSLLSLEPRLMFDAAAAATAAEVQSEQVAQDQAEAAVSSEAAGDHQTAEQNESQNLLQAIAAYNPGESTTEVVFVDPTVPDCQTLLAGIGSNAEVIMLDSARDGVEQIAESLAGRSGIDAIHLISHGSSGELQLGAGTLTAESMSGEYADELATIREALSDQADILVYGCDFAEGHNGQEAATLLSQLTGADVAASTDATGFAGLGGDWMLETQIGTIETQIAVDDGVQANWVGLLAGETPPTITNLSGDSRAYSEGAGAVVIESGNAVVADVDSPNLDTGTLTVSIPAGGDSAEDALNIRNQGTGAGQIGVSGSTVTYGGTTIGTFTGGSSGSNLVITLNSNATPVAVTALVRNITYQNTDTTAPTPGARTVQFVLTDGDGGTSVNYDTTVTVSGVNDAPVLADTALSLTVAEDAGVPSGAVGSVVSAFTGGITDGDSGASKGLAITGRNQTNGTWYYTTNGGSTWTAVGTVSNTSALLLADNGNTRLYFAPNANYTGTSSAALTVRAWDQSSGTAGTKVSTASNGGTTAFSSATDTVDVIVTAVNDAPTDLALSANTVAENAANGTVVGTVSGTDPNAGDTKMYSLTDSAGGRFAIDGSTGIITVADGTLLDYENTPSHAVTVRVTDSGGLTYDETFTINLTNVNEAPTGADATVTINEDISHTLTTANFGFSDVDAGDTMSAVRIDSLPSAGTLTLSGMAVTAGQVVTMADITAGNLVFMPAADANGTGYANFTFSVRDSNNAYDPTPNQLTFNVTAINDAPTDLSLSANIVPENAATGTVVGTVSGMDPDAGDTKTYSLTDNAGGRFGINSATGVITVADGTLLDYESTPSHTVTVRVTDSGGLTYDEMFTINLTNVNEAPTDLALSANTGAENAATGTVVGTVSGTDPDAGDTKTYSLTDNAGGRFGINSATGVITVADGTLLDYESTPSHTVTVRVTDSGGLTYDEMFTINLTNVNEAPISISLSGNTVEENAVNGTVVGTVSTVDPDSGDAKTYTLTNSAGGRFAINSSTGVLTVANGSLLNYEAVTSHSITVRVTDSGGLTYDKTFTITLTDAYEPLPFPSMSGSSVASNSMAIHESGPTLSSPDVSGETGRAEFRPPEDLRKAIEIMTETPPPIDTANLEGKHLGVVREESFEKVEPATEENEFLPVPLSENKTEGKVTAQDHGDSALLISDHHVDSQRLDRTSESTIGTAMGVGLAGIVLQGAGGTKERLIANIRRPREHAEGTSLDMESELSSEDDSRSLHNEAEHDGPISSKPDAA